MQYVTSTSFLLLTYAKYLTSAHTTAHCAGRTITPNALRAIAQKQVPILQLFSFNFLILLFQNFKSFLGSACRSITCWERIHWRCHTWSDMAAATRRESTTEARRCRRLQSIQPRSTAPPASPPWIPIPPTLTCSSARWSEGQIRTTGFQMSDRITSNPNRPLTLMPRWSVL